MLYSANAIAIAPGETIREQLETRGMSQKEFAARMGMTEKHISHLINGKVELTKDVALRLESVLGLQAHFWNNLEAIYREQLVRVKMELEQEKDEEIARRMPYAKMASLGWVKRTRNIKEKINNLRNFFEVASLGFLEKLCVPGIVYRTAGISETSDYALAAWSQKARVEARKFLKKPVNIEKLKEYLPKIRALTLKSPNLFCRELTSLLANCGIAIVFLPHIDGSFLHGASFVDGKHIVIALTVRGKYADKFWFSLFHELDHIIEGHINNPYSASDEQENHADSFASNTLIPSNEYQDFLIRCDKSEREIVAFASRIGVDVGIVLGRMQKDNIIPYNRYNNLRTQYQIDESTSNG
jgi:HTH-type transcriptional regulator/antitoxin HigA